jgi:hypothetical protein
MEQARQQLGRNQDRDAEEQQDEALDRLDEARRELERAREDAEEELAREQLGKIADAIKRLKERQEAMIAEAQRIQREVLQNKGWNRGLLISLGDLARNQQGLGQETAGLAKDKLTAAKVFARLLQRAAEAMEHAGEGMTEHRQSVSRDPANVAEDEESAKLQQEALRRLNQLLDALKTERGQRLAGQPGGQAPGGNNPGGANPGGDGIPALAQLKLLRAMQADVNQRTEDFNKQHPDLAKLNDKERTELKGLRRDQQEVADLVEELTQPPDADGDKP